MQSSPHILLLNLDRYLCRKGLFSSVYFVTMPPCHIAIYWAFGDFSVICLSSHLPFKYFLIILSHSSLLFLSMSCSGLEHRRPGSLTCLVSFEICALMNG